MGSAIHVDVRTARHVHGVADGHTVRQREVTAGRSVGVASSGVVSGEVATERTQPFYTAPLVAGRPEAKEHSATGAQALRGPHTREKWLWSGTTAARYFSCSGQAA